MNPSAVNPGPAHAAEQSLAELIEELSARLEAGSPVDLPGYLEAHPEHADELRRLFPALQLLADWSRSGSANVPLPAAGLEAAPADLGDFRIGREVGRGGMGVVYEAEQLSLRRRVALKVLPFASTLDSKQLQRFKNEAQAAACLHHTNIVPVFATGCERGVHYYAMQFIEGRTVAALIAELRQQSGLEAADEERSSHAVHQPARADATGPWVSGNASRNPEPTADSEPAPSTLHSGPVALSTARSAQGPAHFRTVAHLGVQAAEALEHAHQLGVVHRDIKPANLLVDERGNLWITDFGLAHCKGQAGLTVTGDLVGTLRYMSPEQALAQRVVVDHRTDIYSLGTTLYELLTLEPAYGGKDRQELLRQIAFEEPRPPRRVNRGVPADLETIVLKAMEKNPADRYATAQVLAEDLRRYMRDEPVRARRPTLAQRVRKWGRRHRAAVRAVAAVLLLAAMLGGGTWASWAQRRAGAETEARAALQEANRLLEQERWPEALGTTRLAAGVLAGVGADPGLRRQVEELSKDLELAQSLQEAHLRATEVKDGRFAAELAMAGYAQAFREYGLGPDRFDPQEAAERIRRSPIRRQLVAALDHWAVVGRMVGAPDWSWASAAARAADRDAWRNQLRDAWGRKDNKAMEELLASAPAEGEMLFFRLIVGNRPRGGAADERALSLLRQAQAQRPDDFWANHNLACCLHHSQLPRLEEAIRYYTAAVALRPQSAGARMNLGLALKDKGDLEEAIARFREAIHLQADCALAHYDLGGLLTVQGRLDEAVAEFREALRLKKDFAEAHVSLSFVLSSKGQLDEAVAECREALRLKPDYAEAHSNLGAALKDKGRLDEAIAECREGLRLKNDIPEAHVNLGAALAGKGRLDEAIIEFREAIQIKPDYAGAHNGLGAALAGRGRLDEAVAEFHEALRLKNDIPEAHYNLGIAFFQQGRFHNAVKAIGRGHELGSRNPRWPYPSARWLRRAEQMAELDDRLAAVLEGKAQPKDADERIAFARLCQEQRKRCVAAERFYADAFTAQPTLADDLQRQHRYNAACAAALAGCGQGKDADSLDDKERARLRRQALDWCRADLAAWQTRLEKEPNQARPVVAKLMQHWLVDPDFAGVRGHDALVNLPEAEWPEWQKLWADVAETLAQAQSKPSPQGKAGRND
jgi:serine/threonine protein kinase/Flp pilus assembly protein TadD